jgi:hypothetical protein
VPKFFIFLILAAAAICLPNARALASSGEFLAAGLEIPQNLQARGYSNFGPMDLATLVSQMQGVQVQFSSKLTAAKRNQNGRISARWEVTSSGRIIHVFSPLWNRFTEQRSMLALHEYLGILGYYDDNYWLSTQLWTLSLPDSQALSYNERARIEKSISIRAQPMQQVAGGGVVGVGGGGEGATIWVRQRRIKESLEQINRGTGDRDQAIGTVNHELEGTVEAGYGGFESPAVVKRAKEMMSRKNSYCMVSGGLCRKFSKDRQSSNCTCSRLSASGTIVYTEAPWDILD